MNCKTAHAYLTAWVDGELRGWWRRRVLLRHLRGCARCRQQAEIQQQIKTMLRTRARPLKAPAAVRARIQQMLARTSPSTRT